MAGHSLGEYSALVAAGALEFADAVRLVATARAIHAGSGARGRRRDGRDSGLAPADVAEICSKAADGEVVSPANLNSPEQTVISGNAAAVKRAVEMASQAAPSAP